MLTSAKAAAIVQRIFSPVSCPGQEILPLPDRARLERLATWRNAEAYHLARNGHDDYSERLYAQAERIAPNSLHRNTSAGQVTR